MQNWNIHTPEGIQDIMFKDCQKKKETEKRTREIFESRGFLEVEPPTIEFYDVFSRRSGAIEQEAMFKFFDQQGRILVLRPDITTSIARICATKLGDLKHSVRFSYIGNVFRFDEVGAGRLKQREFTQAGIEILGLEQPEADAEVIATVIDVIRATGLENFQIEIGQVEFFKGLMEQAGFNEIESEKIRELIENKDYIGIEDILKDKSIDKNVKSLIMELPGMFGSIEIIDKVYSRVENNRARNALDNLKAICDILKEYDMEKYISIDLGMVQSINYYTGMIFRGITHGVGFSICGGGRYDKLVSEFGKDIPATGAAIGINRLMLALDRQNIKIELPQVETLLSYLPQGRKTAIQVAQELRRQGLKVELNLGAGGIEDVREYVKDKGIKGLILVKDSEKIEIHNLCSGEISEVSVDELLRR